MCSPPSTSKKQTQQYCFFQRRVKGGRGGVNISMSDLRLILISSLCAAGRGVERHGEVPVGVLWTRDLLPREDNASGGACWSCGIQLESPLLRAFSAHFLKRCVILASHLSDPKKAWANKLFLYPKSRASGAHQS